MKTPRLALLALWALLAPSFAAATDPAWTPKVQPGDAWTAVQFESESKDAKHYWFRSDATGNNIPLYILTLKPNPSVKDSSYYESVASGYALNITPPAGGKGRTYSVVRSGSKLAFVGTTAGSLGASAWAVTHKTAYPGGLTVVVAAPNGAPEKLSPTPISVFTPGLDPVKWSEYYYTRAPEEGHWYSDPDSAYRQMRLSYADMHGRVLPFEYLFDKDKCFVRPEACVGKNKPEYTRFMEAAGEAAQGNLLLVEPIALDSHKYYSEQARNFKAELDKGPADQFTEPENKLLQNLLINNEMMPAFQTELRGVKPEQMPLFVKKWRGYLKNEIDAYLADAEKAGNKRVPHGKIRAEMTARITAAAALPLGAVAVTPVKPGEPGKPVKPGDPVTPPKPMTPDPVKKPEAKLWANEITSIDDWHAIHTSKIPITGNLSVPLPSLTFYCYHRNLKANETLAHHLNKWHVIVECVNWSAPKDDTTQEDAAKKLKYKVRNHLLPAFDVAFVNGKLTTLNTGIKVEVTELKTLPDTLSGEKFVKVTSPQAPAVAGSLPLSDKEVSWLEKMQAIDHATAKAATDAKPAEIAEKYRKNIVENLQPRKDVSDLYEAAVLDPKATQKSIDATLTLDMWGKKNTAVVELSGDNEEIQLSAADYKELTAKFADAASTYRERRAMVTDPKNARYDPIVLHKSAEAARKVMGKVAGAPSKRKVLAPAEIALLTPAEALEYEKYRRSAMGVDGKVDETNDGLLSYAEALRKKMAGETPPRTSVPPVTTKPEDMTLAGFNRMGDSQKRQFCKDYPLDIAVVEGDRRAGDIDNATANALAGAQNSNAAPVTKPKPDAPAKFKPVKEIQDACRALPPEDIARIDPSRAVKPDSGIGGNLTVGNGEDVNGKKKIKTEWLSIPLVQTAVVGGLAGLVVGSLFGPLGLIVGPLIGAALSYGLSVHAANKAKASGDE